MQKLSNITGSDRIIFCEGKCCFYLIISCNLDSRAYDERDATSSTLFVNHYVTLVNAIRMEAPIKVSDYHIIGRNNVFYLNNIVNLMPAVGMSRHVGQFHNLDHDNRQ